MKDWKKYLIEFVVIVVGILTAIQLEDWNQDRKDRAKEKLLLRELHAEFLNNKAQFQNVIRAHKETLNSFDFFLSLASKSNSEIDRDSVNHHLFKLYYGYTFNPSQGIINSIINSSNIDLISDDELRKRIITWGDIIKDYQEEEEKSAELVTNLVIPYQVKYLKGFTFTDHNLNMFKRDEFQQIMFLRKGFAGQILNNDDQERKKVEDAINDIIRLTETSD